ncbi:MAG: hypothetical protein JW839_14770 [Candidatus Lokiarchaeota archaeon]|nr:hypothetical protein [Candidatus Lokiarchaeota archaeon]
MPGIFHVFFGITVGLLVWKLSEGKNGEKRFSLPLIFVFAINNYIGPDLKAIIDGIGNAFGSPAILALGNAVHSYAGFLLFALPYAVGWYGILFGIDRLRARNAAKAGIASDEPILHASYPKVLLMVVAGGIMHHFIDCIGHVYRYPVSGWYYPQGRFILIPSMSPDFWLAYVVLVAFIAGAAVAYLVVGIYRRRFTLAEKMRAAFTKETAIAAAFVGVVVLNVLMMYGILASGDLLRSDSKGITFMLGNLLHVTLTMFESKAIWWIAVTSAPTLVLFFLCYVKGWRLRGTTIRADLFVLLCYLAALAVGYALQPVIGNVSGSEADAGALVFTWSTIGSALLAFFLARDWLPSKREPATASA